MTRTQYPLHIVGLIGKLGSGKSLTKAMVVSNNLKLKKQYDKKTDTKLFYHLHVRSKYKLINKIRRFLIDKLYVKKHFDYIFSTDEDTEGTIHITYEDLGKYKPIPNSLYILEEAGLGVDGRNFASLPKLTKRFFAYIRHSNSCILWISQSPDVDKTLRVRTDKIFFLRALGPLFSIANYIPFKLTVDENTHDIVEGYFFQNLFADFFQLITCSFDKSPFPFQGTRLILKPLYYHLTNSFEDTYKYPAKLLLSSSKPSHGVITAYLEEGGID